MTTDHLGSPRVITDQNGNVTSRKDFSAFGEETITPQRMEGLKYQPPGIRQDYTGYQKDDESGLEFAQARYYNPTHGRFTSVDPLTASASIRNPQTFNRYSYVLNSPYKFTDPLGLLSVTTGACGSWCPGSDGGMGSGAFNAAGDSGGFLETFYLVTQTITYTASASYRSSQATITVTVTEQWIENGSGQRVGSYNPDPTVAASLSNVRNFSPTQQDQIRTIAETSAQSALKLGVDVGEFLGIVQQETQFGMFPTSEGPRKNSVSNPSQYSGGRAQIAAWRSPEYQSVLEYNLEQSIIHVYFWAAGKSNGTLWSRLYYWNGSTRIRSNGREERVNFANDASAIINGIQASRSVRTQRSSFWSFGVPSAPPARGLTPCRLLIPC